MTQESWTSQTACAARKENISSFFEFEKIVFRTVNDSDLQPKDDVFDSTTMSFRIKLSNIFNI
jgi:hypothetical protein